MKNLFYLPFLLLMAVTYSKIVENAKDKSFESNRAPASAKEFKSQECE